MLLQPKSLARILIVIVLFLFTANLVCIYAAFILEDPFTFGWRFYFDRGLNFPSLFSLLLLIIGIFSSAANISTAKENVQLKSANAGTFWITLTVSLSLIVIDKIFFLHNLLRMKMLRKANFDSSSLLYFSWITPYIVIFLFLGLVLIKSFPALPRVVRKQLLKSGAVYIFGGVVLEFLGYYYRITAGKNSEFAVNMIRSVEELFQMIGLIFCIYSMRFYKQEVAKEV
jgi:hypothetical protein